MTYEQINLVLIAIHVVLEAADVAITYKGIKMGIREANPIARFFIDKFHKDVSWLIKLVIPAGLLWYTNIVPLTIAMNVFILFIVVRNIKIMKQAKERLKARLNG